MHRKAHLIIYFIKGLQASDKNIIKSAFLPSDQPIPWESRGTLVNFKAWAEKEKSKATANLSASLLLHHMRIQDNLDS